MTTCHVCNPPIQVVVASLHRGPEITLDAVPHPAGLYTLSTVNGWVRASKIARDQPAANRHRLRVHRGETA